MSPSKNPCLPTGFSNAALTTTTDCPDPGPAPGSSCGDAMWQQLAGGARLIDGSGCHENCEPGTLLQSQAARQVLASLFVPDGCYFWKACVPKATNQN